MPLMSPSPTAHKGGGSTPDVAAAPATPSTQRISFTPIPILEPQQTKRLVPVLAHSPMPKLNTPPPANTSRYGRTLKPPKVHVDYQTD